MVGGWARSLMAIPAVLALGWLSIYAARLGVASAGTQRAAGEIESWAGGRQPSADAFAATRDALEEVRGQVPRDPSVHELLGIAKARAGPEYVADAAVEFKRAVALRPASGYAWANLVSANYRLGRTDGAFEKALAHAAELGPYEPEVQQLVAHFGLAVWNEVSGETRVAVEKMVSAGMRRNPPEMLQIAQRRGRLDVACRHFPVSSRQTNPKWAQICDSVEATS